MVEPFSPIEQCCSCLTAVLLLPGPCRSSVFFGDVPVGRHGAVFNDHMAVFNGVRPLQPLMGSRHLFRLSVVILCCMRLIC